MKSHHIWISTLILLLGLNLFQYFYFKYSSSGEVRDEMASELGYQKGLAQMHKDMYLEVYSKIENILAFEDTQLSDTITLRNAHGQSFPIREVIGNDSKLVLYYSEVNCQTCVNENLDRIKDLAKAVGEEHVLILASGGRIEDIQRFMRLNRYQTDIIFLTEELCLPFELASAPLLFKIDDSMQVKMAFLPSKEHQETSDFYFSLIKRRFEEKM